MTFDVKLPDIGEGVAEGEIVRWLVRAGEAVREDQPLVEVMTDKASVEIPSPRDGTITALHAEEGAMVPVGTVIVSIAVAGEAAAAPVGVPHAPGSAAVSAAPASPVAGNPAARIEATPAVRALARDLGVALDALSGSGPGGRITADDVRGAAGGSAAPALASPPPPDEPVERVPLRGLRRRIAEHMRRSVSTTASFTFVGECDWTAVAAHRRSIMARRRTEDPKLTYLAYVLRAVIEPLQRFPLLNASLDDERQEIVLRRYFHLGVATSTEDGLTVPILHHADRLGLLAIAREIERLSRAAREHHLKVEELQGGTFTVTSTGAHGGVLATPILHHPQVAILGVHEVRRRPAVVGEQIVPRDLGNLSLTLDHRVVDGAVGADFLYALIERLEHPDTWLTSGDLS